MAAPVIHPIDIPNPPASGLDPGALGRLEDLDPSGERGVVLLILRTFETSLTKMMGELAAQTGAADPKIVFGLAHTLKSSAASVGAQALSAACADVEAALRPPQGGAPDSSAVGSTLDPQIARLQAEAGIAMRLLQATLATRGKTA